MNGCVIANTPIAVDLWHVRRCPHVRIFFLSHLHADHIQGLTSSWKHPIYCTPLTKKLLIHKLQVEEDLVRPLDVGQSHIIPLDENAEENMTVSVLDANHCPGSAMFLFQGYFGTILYTGDFRFCESMFVETPLSRKIEVDVVYLDNTYCHPDCNFPQREEVKKDILRVIAEHRNHRILIGVRSLGKEGLLADIAMHFQTYIVVQQTLYETLQILEAKDVFTTDPREGWIHAVPFQRVNKVYLEQLNKTLPTIAILPTALYAGAGGKPYSNQSKIFPVPYSDHSSYRELHRFVSKIKPKKIVSIVQGKARTVFGQDMIERANVACFSLYLDQRPAQSVTVPESVQKYMDAGHRVVQSQLHMKRKKSMTNGRLYKRPAKMGVVFDGLTPKKGSEESNKLAPHSTKAGENNSLARNGETNINFFLRNDENGIITPKENTMKRKDEKGRNGNVLTRDIRQFIFPSQSDQGTVSHDEQTNSPIQETSPNRVHDNLPDEVLLDYPSEFIQEQSAQKSIYRGLLKFTKSKHSKIKYCNGSGKAAECSNMQCGDGCKKNSSTAVNKSNIKKTEIKHSGHGLNKSEKDKGVSKGKAEGMTLHDAIQNWQRSQENDSRNEIEMDKNRKNDNPWTRDIRQFIFPTQSDQETISPSPPTLCQGQETISHSPQTIYQGQETISPSPLCHSKNTPQTMEERQDTNKCQVISTSEENSQATHERHKDENDISASYLLKKHKNVLNNQNPIRISEEIAYKEQISQSCVQSMFKKPSGNSPIWKLSVKPVSQKKSRQEKNEKLYRTLEKVFKR